MNSPFTFPKLEHPFLETAINATQLGAQELVSRFGKRVSVETKGLANFVSEADLAAEKAIIQRIRQDYPSHDFMAEESHQSVITHAEHLWIIDPLDGTSNFLHGIPHFAVSIAYYHHGLPQLGIVANPITGDCYSTVVEQGAWHGTNRQCVCPATAIDQIILSCGFYYDRGRMMRATLDTLGAFFQNNIHGMRRFGAAALDLCNVGCGQYGLFFEYKLHPWDYAAGQLFVTEAGGRVTDCNGHPLSLSASSSICATNGAVHDQALSIIGPCWNDYAESLRT
ncbi:MAG: inositol monophosphatase family protein [Pirellula sp.]|jgi:myo-inositol-1(or 4)-monophosphatase|nr:inositol monophosphatase [Pirellula sp.]